MSFRYSRPSSGRDLWFFNRVYDRTPAITGFSGESSAEVGAVDLEVTANGGAQHTGKYELVQGGTALVIRRGNSFNLSVSWRGRGFDQRNDRLKLVFNTGDSPSVPKGTSGVAVVGSGGREGAWRAEVTGKQGSGIRIRVSVPGTAPVGEWQCSLVTSTSDRPAELRTHLVDSPVYILFNPWLATDPTHLPSERERAEYLLEEQGKIYAGSAAKPKGRPWVYGQFSATVLPAACHLLATSSLRAAERSNPVKVARAISAMVNSNDGDRGVLVGRWDGEYSGGTEPFRWTGSVAILEQYMAAGGRPVRYGQCWVFAGLVTTICRALGLASRADTCYSSAHDTDSSLTIDKYYDQEGEELTSAYGALGIRDSIWNFHCWNDVWMTRSDLPPGYGGWQTIDSTPQEQSDQRFRLGPASVTAVRNGEVGLGYDTAFVFTEVNADVVVYVRDPSSSWGFRRTDKNTTHIGQLLLTKAVGGYSDDPKTEDWEDITALYKRKEGTMGERTAVENALSGCGPCTSSEVDPAARSGREDVVMEVKDLSTGEYGKPYKVSVFLQNKARAPRTVRVVLSSHSAFYTGTKAHLVKRGEGEFTMQVGEQETLSMVVAPEAYMDKVVDMCLMKNSLLVTVAETGQSWSAEDDFVLEKPELQLRLLDSQLRLGRAFRLELSFTNPLDVSLQDCVVSVEAAQLVRAREANYPSIGPGEKVRAVLPLVSRNRGSSVLTVVFNSRQLFDITGTLKLTVV